MCESKAQEYEEYKTFRLDRARERYDYELERSGRLYRRGLQGAGYTIPLMSGALYYLALQLAKEWSTLRGLDFAQAVLVGAAALVGLSMVWRLYAAGLKGYEYSLLPAPRLWWQGSKFSSWDDAYQQYAAHLLKSAEQNYEINEERQGHWSHFVKLAGTCTGLVILAAIVDLIRRVG